MSNQTNKKTREDIILDKIVFNIDGIYRNKKIESHILHLREMFKIPNGLYKDNKAAFDEEVGIDELLDKLFKIWADSIPENGPIIQEICKNISLLFTEYSVGKKEALKLNLPYPSKKNYATDLLRNFLNGKTIVYHLMKRNSDVWKKIISARLLTIPRSVVLKNKKSILTDFLPQVYDNLTIQIHEMTEIEDFKLIKDEIKKKKEAFKNKYGWKTNFEENKLYQRNKRAYELRIIEKKPYKETRHILEKEMPELISENCEDSYINKMVKSHIQYTDDTENPE